MGPQGTPVSQEKNLEVKGTIVSYRCCKRERCLKLRDLNSIYECLGMYGHYRISSQESIIRGAIATVEMGL
jgi:hypothetical protein